MSEQTMTPSSDAIPFPNAKRCNAKAKRSGEQCKNPAVAGRDKCRNHGGTRKRGAESHAFKHGGYTPGMRKYEALLPAVEDRDAYLRSMESDDQLSLRDEIGLLDVRLMQLAKKAGGAESGKTWAALRELRKEFSANQRSSKDIEEKTREGQRILDDIWRLIDVGYGEWASWRDAEQTILSKEKIVRSERKRLHEERRLISIEACHFLLGQMAAAVLEVVPDPRQQALIAERYILLSGRSDLFNGEDDDVIDAEIVSRGTKG